jgi:hemoglobin/transferrin/lactoferrin receptor protein
MNLGALGLSFGARLDDYDVDYGSHNFSGDEVSPNLGATYDLIKGLTAFASYGEATRASGVIPGSWMTNIGANTRFDVTEPEKSKQWQGGLRYLGQSLLMADDHLRLSGTYFDTLIKNRIEAAGRRGVISEVRNGDDLTSKGFELRAAWGLPNFETSLNFTHVTLEDEDGNPVGVIRRVAGASGDRLVWDNRWQPMDQVTLGYTMDLVFRLTDVPEGEPERPGYVVHNIQAVYEPNWCPNLMLNLVVNNLFDARYAEHTTIYSPWGTVEEPGLDIRLGLTYKF